MQKILIVLGTILLSAAVGAENVMLFDGKKFGVSTEGMSSKDYQELVFLNPQNTTRMDWKPVGH